MSEPTPIPAAETVADRVLSFTLSQDDAMGRVVRLGPVLETILSAHSYPPVAERLLAEALVLTTLLGAGIKDEAGQITLQAQTQAGAISLLVCDYRGGELRGHLAFDAGALADLGPQPDLPALFGDGFLGITIEDSLAGGRYQGIVPLEGASLAEAAERYFRQSLQLPTVVRLAAGRDDVGCVAGGVLMQTLASGEVGHERIEVREELRGPADLLWEHVATLAETISPAELIDRRLSLEALVWRLFHDEGEVRAALGPVLTRGCRCDPDYLASVLARFPQEDRAEMIGDDGMIGVDCAFCSRRFALDPAALTSA